MLSVVGAGRDAVVDVATGSVVLELYRDEPTFDHSWNAEGSLLLTAQENALLLWSIEPDQRRFAEVIASGDWEGLAVEMLTRGLTPGECSIYRIDPCRSLEDLRDR